MCCSPFPFCVVCESCVLVRAGACGERFFPMNAKMENMKKKGKNEMKNPRDKPRWTLRFLERICSLRFLLCDARADQIVGNWYLQGVCDYSGVDLCFLVCMMRTLILRSRSEAKIHGHHFSVRDAAIRWGQGYMDTQLKMSKSADPALCVASAKRSRVLVEVFDDCSSVSRRLSLLERAIREVHETVFALNFLETASVVGSESFTKSGLLHVGV